MVNLGEREGLIAARSDPDLGLYHKYKKVAGGNFQLVDGPEEPNFQLVDGPEKDSRKSGGN